MSVPASGGSFDLLGNAPAALFVLGIDGTILAHNAGMQTWFGDGEDEGSLQGRNIVEWLTAASRLLYETQVMPRLLETGRLREVMLEFRGPGGVRRAVLVNAELERRAEGNSVAYIAAVETTVRAAFEKELVAARREADLSHRRLVLLQDATSALAVADGLDDLGEALVSAAERATVAAWTALRLVDTGDQADGVREWGASPPGVVLDARPAASADQLVCRDLDEIAQAAPQDVGAMRAAGIEALVTTPIARTTGERTVILGEIHCWFRRSRSLEADELETLRALAAQAERVVDHLRLRDRLRHHALHDGLTGLPNRTLFEERLTRMLTGAVGSGEPCAVLFLDLDGFKAINDQRGHGVGDEVLQVIGERLREACRVGDTVARLGGDEFLVAASGIDEAATALLAERIRDAVRAPLAGAAAGSPLSASVGAVHWMPEARASAPAAADLVAAADAAMYAAKRGGKDRVRVEPWPG